MRKPDIRRPHEVAAPLVPEVEGHHLRPHHGIGRRPGLGLEPEDEELGRERPRPPFHPRVDPGDIGVDPAPRAGGEALQGSLRPMAEAEPPQQAVGGEGGRPQHLGEAARTDPPVHLHLPQPVLSMDVAEGEEGVLLVPGEHVRDAVPVAHHLHRRDEAGDDALAVDLGERPPEPQVAAAHGRRGQHEEGERRPDEPPQEHGHAGLSPTRTDLPLGPLRSRPAPGIAGLPYPAEPDAAPAHGGAGTRQDEAARRRRAIPGLRGRGFPPCARPNTTLPHRSRTGRGRGTVPGEPDMRANARTLPAGPVARHLDWAARCTHGRLPYA